MAIVSMKALLETGVHFGHRTRKWNPKMKPYIFTERNGIHIIDLQQTIVNLEEACRAITDTVAEGGTILFVGTKRQAQETIAREAERCGMPYVNQRWLGGTLTNWRTIRQRIETLKELEERRDRGEFNKLTKKEAIAMERKIAKLQERLGGIRDMKELPAMLYVVDVRRERTAVHEANILNIPIVALVDTNCDPDNIDYVIPANDDAIRAIKLLTGIIADAVLAGIDLRQKGEGDGEEFVIPIEEGAGDEAYLGEAILEKLASGELSFDDEEEYEPTEEYYEEEPAQEYYEEEEPPEEPESGEESEPEQTSESDENEEE